MTTGEGHADQAERLPAIYRVINSLLVAQNADATTASIYFASFGAFILKQHYKLNAAPKGGLAAYNLGGTVLLFADHR